MTPRNRCLVINYDVENNLHKKIINVEKKEKKSTYPSVVVQSKAIQSFFVTPCHIPSKAASAHQVDSPSGNKAVIKRSKLSA